jgi:hypothetical protein
MKMAVLMSKREMQLDAAIRQEASLSRDISPEDPA